LTADAFEQRIEDDITKYGWHCPLVLGDDDGPTFAYTIGFGFAGDWPECMVIGQSHELMHAMLGYLWDGKGTEYQLTDGEICRDLVEGFACILRQVHTSHFDDYFGRGCGQYIKRNNYSMRMMQVFWPDKSGKYPWEADCNPAAIERQPLLYLPKEGGTL
jgi:Domain of unknown function (DUF4262)